MWYLIVSVAWLGLAVAVYGDLEKALEGTKTVPENRPRPFQIRFLPTPERRPFSLPAECALSAYFASAYASFFGGLVAPLLLGPFTRVRRPILLSSACGGGLAAFIGMVVGPLIGCLGWALAPSSMFFMTAALGISLPVGLVCGWLCARIVNRARMTT
jgi:hypothetical protein